jgi:hypothetical protein
VGRGREAQSQDFLASATIKQLDGDLPVLVMGKMQNDGTGVSFLLRAVLAQCLQSIAELVVHVGDVDSLKYVRAQRLAVR